MVPEIWSTTDIIFSHFGPIFVLLPPIIPDYWKNEKNLWRYHHFTLVYHKWQSYDILLLRYQVDRQIFLSFWAIFCPFTPLTTPKIRFWKKWKKKKCLEISSFYTSAPKIMIICYIVPEILWCMTDVIFIFHLGLFFAF